MNYSIFHKDHIPEQMLAKHGKPARYIGDMLALFCETYESVTGTAHDNIVDVASMGFDTSGEGEGLSPSALTTLVDELLGGPFTGREIQLSKPQGRWLHKNDPRFMPQEEEV